MHPLIQLLIYAAVFALVAYGLYMICTKFLAAFPPALWICGIFLLVVLLLVISGQIDGPFGLFPTKHL